MIILGLDPGETTGTIVFNIPEGTKTIPLKKDISSWVVFAGELINWPQIEEIIKEHKPNIIVFEEFRLYEEKAKTKSHSSFPEVKIIGQIEMIAEKECIPTHKQSASIAKQFYTDTKLKDLHLWQRGAKHARDAIRHALYFYDFNRKKVFKDGV